MLMFLIVSALFMMQVCTLMEPALISISNCKNSFPGGNSMGVNGGVGVQPPNQQSAVLSNAMLHSNMNAQR